MTQPAEDVEDYLTEDPELTSQKIVLLSFLSPEKILKNKDIYMFQQFVKDYGVQWKTSKLEAWLAEQVNSVNSKLEALAGKIDCMPGVKDLSGADASSEIRKNLLRVEHLVEEFQQYVRKTTGEIKESTLQEDYDTFVFKNGGKLEEEFFKMNEYRTTIRGIKVRGVFASEGEAQIRAKRLQKADPNFNIYLGAVGKWMAWEPDPNKVTDSEYANDELNNLMKKYRENEENRDVFYNEQKKSRVEAATKKPAMGITVEPTAEAAAAEPTPTVETSYSGMFNEPTDVFLSRKKSSE
jgi:hypothetical protein